MQYTGSIDNRGILEIIRRSCSYVDARLMNHGYRVAYIVSEMLKPYFPEDTGRLLSGPSSRHRRLQDR